MHFAWGDECASAVDHSVHARTCFRTKTITFQEQVNTVNTQSEANGKDVADATENGPVDREALYEEVWSDPIVVVARRYGLSDVGLLKACRRMGIPVPTRGYWAKVRAGKVMRKLPLPPLRTDRAAPVGPTPLTAEARKVRDSIKAAVSAARSASRKSSESPAAAAPVKAEGSSASTPQKPASAERLHPLIQSAKTRLQSEEGWDLDSGVRAAPKEVFDLQATRRSLKRGLQLANLVLYSLESHGFVFSIDTERGQTIAAQEGTRLTIQIVEKVTRTAHKNTPAEERSIRAYHDSWRTGRSLPYPSIPPFDYHGTGRFTVTIGKFKRRNWNDTANTDLLDRIDEIVFDTLKLAAEIRADEERERLRDERYQAAEAKYQAAMTRRAREESSLRKLGRDAARYRKAEMLRQYVNAFEAQARRDGSLAPEVQQWIRWARAKVDWIDPFIAVSDVVLDAPLPERPSRWNF